VGVGLPVGVGVGVGFGVGFGVRDGVGVGWPGVGLGVGSTEGGGLMRPESVGARLGLSKGVGNGANDTTGGALGVGPAVGVVCTKIGCDRSGLGVGVTTATTPPFGRARPTSTTPTIKPASASARAARTGSRLFPDATAPRLGYVTPAASPATGKRW